VPAVQAGGTKIAWLDRRGRLVGEVPLPQETFASPQLSPDGRRLALFSDGPKESEADLWVVDLATEKASRLTFAAGLDRYPIWSPDGLRLAFQTERSGVFDLWERPATSGGAEKALYASPTSWKIARSWIGDSIAFETVEKATGFDVWLLRVGRPEEPPVHLLSSPASEHDPAISPDGRWLAYASNESGRDELYVVSLPDTKTKYQVTTEGGRHPVWTRGGRELFYMTSAFAVAAVPVTPGESLAFGSPVTLFPQPRPNWGTGADQALFDVSDDGERVVVVVPENQGSQTLVVVTDWLAELKREKSR
jgi:Tol biopolymer transport system component